jgi:hypothetical protein
MMRAWIAGALVLAGLIATPLFVPPAWLFLALPVGLAVLGWAVRCPHPGPLGLLPPLTTSEGTRTSPQWFCSRCGKTWAAAFDHDHPPIRRFDGFDESKAGAAAKRAEMLERQQRALAVRRSGVEPNKRPTLVTPELAEVVSMARGRRFGK